MRNGENNEKTSEKVSEGENKVERERVKEGMVRVRGRTREVM